MDRKSTRSLLTNLFRRKTLLTSPITVTLAIAFVAAMYFGGSEDALKVDNTPIDYESVLNLASLVPDGEEGIRVLDLRGTACYPQPDQLVSCGSPDTLAILLFTKSETPLGPVEVNLELGEGLQYGGFAMLGSPDGMMMSILDEVSTVNPESPVFRVNSVSADAGGVVLHIAIQAVCGVNFEDNPPSLTVNLDYNDCQESIELDPLATQPLTPEIVFTGTPDAISITDVMTNFCLEQDITQITVDAAAGEATVTISDYGFPDIMLDSVAVGGFAVDPAFIEMNPITGFTTIVIDGNAISDYFGGDGLLDQNEVETIEFCFQIAECPPSDLELPINPTMSVVTTCDEQACGGSADFEEDASINISPNFGSLPLAVFESQQLPAACDDVTGGPQQYIFDISLQSSLDDPLRGRFDNLRFLVDDCDGGALFADSVQIFAGGDPMGALVTLPLGGSAFQLDDDGRLFVSFRGLSDNLDGPDGLEDLDGDGFYDDLEGGDSLRIRVYMSPVSCGPAGTCGQDSSSMPRVCQFFNIITQGIRHCNVTMSISSRILPPDPAINSTSSGYFGNTENVGSASAPRAGYDFGNFGDRNGGGGVVRRDTGVIRGNFTYTLDADDFSMCPAPGGDVGFRLVYVANEATAENIWVDSVVFNGVPVPAIDITKSVTDGIAVFDIDAGDPTPGVMHQYAFRMQLDTPQCAPETEYPLIGQVIEDCPTCDCSPFVRACQAVRVEVNPDDYPNCNCNYRAFTSAERITYGYTDRTKSTPLTRDSFALGDDIELDRVMPGDTVRLETSWVLDEADAYNNRTERLDFISRMYQAGSANLPSLIGRLEVDAARLQKATVHRGATTFDLGDITPGGGLAGTYDGINLISVSSSSRNENAMHPGLMPGTFNHTQGNSSSDYQDGAIFRMYFFGEDRVDPGGFNSLQALYDLVGGEFEVGDTVRQVWHIPIVLTPDILVDGSAPVVPLDEEEIIVYGTVGAYDLIGGALSANFAEGGAVFNGSNGATACHFPDTLFARDPGIDLDSEIEYDPTGCVAEIRHDLSIENPIPADWYQNPPEYRPIIGLERLYTEWPDPYIYSGGANYELLDDGNGSVIQEPDSILAADQVGDAYCVQDRFGEMVWLDAERINGVRDIEYDDYDTDTDIQLSGGTYPLVGVGGETATDPDTLRFTVPLSRLCTNQQPETGLDASHQSSYPHLADYRSITYFCNNAAWYGGGLDNSSCNPNPAGALADSRYYWPWGRDHVNNPHRYTEEIISFTEIGVPVPSVDITLSVDQDLVQDLGGGELNTLTVCPAGGESLVGGVVIIEVPNNVVLDGSAPLVTEEMTTDSSIIYSVDIPMGLAVDECFDLELTTTLLFCGPNPICASAVPCPADAELVLIKMLDCVEEVCYNYRAGTPELQAGFQYDVNPAPCQAGLPYEINFNNTGTSFLDSMCIVIYLPQGLTPDAGTFDVTVNEDAGTTMMAVAVAEDTDLTGVNGQAYKIDSMTLSGMIGVGGLEPGGSITVNFEATSVCEFVSGTGLAAMVEAAGDCDPYEFFDRGQPIDVVDPDGFAQYTVVAEPLQINCLPGGSTVTLTSINTGKSVSTDAQVCLTLPPEMTLAESDIDVVSPEGFTIQNFMTMPLGTGGASQISFDAPQDLNIGDFFCLELDVNLTADSPCGEIEFGFNIKSETSVECPTGPDDPCDLQILSSPELITVEVVPQVAFADASVAASCGPTNAEVVLEYEIILESLSGIDELVNIDFYQDLDGDGMVDDFDVFLGSDNVTAQFSNPGDLEVLTGNLTVPEENACKLVARVTLDPDCACNEILIPFPEVAPSAIAELGESAVFCPGTGLPLDEICGDVDIRFIPSSGAEISVDGVVTLNDGFGILAPVKMVVTYGIGTCTNEFCVDLFGLDDFNFEPISINACRLGNQQIDLRIPSSLSDDITVSIAAVSPANALDYLDDPTSQEPFLVDPVEPMLEYLVTYTLNAGTAEECVDETPIFVTTFDPPSIVELDYEFDCAAMEIDLDMVADITPDGLDGQWMTLGDGMFAGGETMYNTATSYIPSMSEIDTGFVVLTLTTEPIRDTVDGVPQIVCGPARDTLIVDVWCLDLALRKVVADTITEPLTYGDTIKYAMQVFNQSTMPIDTLNVIDYLPNGLVFIDDTGMGGLNEGWDGSDAMNPLYGWGGDTLRMGDSDTICLYAQVIELAEGDLTDASYVNQSEISYAENINDEDVSDEDIDGPLNDDPTDNGGGQPDSDADDEIDGNGMGDPGSPDGPTDQDNADPASIVVQSFDLALTKMVTDPADGLVTLGTPVTFTITVFNQGEVAADSISVLDSIPLGFTFDPVLNPGWALGSNVADTTLAFEDGLAPGAMTTVDIVLVVNADAIAGEDLVNLATISSAQDTSGFDREDDDSPMDDVFANDGGGNPDGESDDETMGDGTGSPGSDSPDTDQDNGDPALVTVQVFDLALTKVVTDPADAMVAPGEDVTFTIEVTNQGMVYADSITIVDSIPDGFTFDPAKNPGWNFMDPIADTTLSFMGGLAPMATTSIEMVLTVNADVSANSELVNIAAIGAAQDTLGNDQVDVDSPMDTIFGTDGGGNPGGNSDNQTGGNGTGDPGDDDVETDQDNSDPALIRVLPFDLALTKVVSDPLEGAVLPGQDVTFTIEVTNQGMVTADSIEVLDSIPMGFTFDPTKNPGWSLVGSVADTTLAFDDGLAPAETSTVDIVLTVNADVSAGSDLVNLATIGSAQDTLGNDQEDIDSPMDEVFSNDGGGNPGGNSDNQTGGNGSGAPGSDDANTDQDNGDPALVTVAGFDLALRKTLAVGQPSTLSPGQLVTFTIKVFNQGMIAADSIVVVDSLPTGLVLADPNWTEIGGKVYDTVTMFGLREVLAPDSCVEVSLTAMVSEDAPQGTTLRNYSEIAAATDSLGNEIADIDSDPDDNLGNDNLFEDDEINEDAKNEDGDEDDHDIAEIEIATFDLALRKVLGPDQSSSIVPGSPVTFRIEVINQGEIYADSIVIVDSIPSGFTYETANNTGWTGADGDVEVYQLLTVADGQIMMPGLAPGEKTFVDIVLTSSASLGAGEELINWAEIGTATDTLGNELADVDSQADSLITNEDDVVDNEVNQDGTQAGQDEDDQDFETVRALGFDLALYKILDPDQSRNVAPGDTVCYNIYVANQGDIASDSITVVDSLPAGLDPIIDMTINPGWSMVGDLLVKTLNVGDMSLPMGGLQPTQDTFTSLKVRVSPSATAGSTLTNFAEIGAAQDLDGNEQSDFDSRPDSTLSDDRYLEDNDITGDAVNEADDEDDSDREDINVLPFDLALAKTIISPADAQVAIGDTIVYKITVTNQGMITADSINVIDTFPAGLMPLADLNTDWLDGPIAGLEIQKDILGGVSLAPNEVVCDSVYFEVLPSAASEMNLVNIAEINAALDGNGLVATDIDSEADDNAGDDAGGVPDGSTDDFVDGNGEGTPGVDIPGLDEDDHDPAVVSLLPFDLALTKTVADPVGGMVSPGDTVTYEIKVYNQGEVAADSLVVRDSFQSGLVWAATGGWTPVGLRTVDTSVVVAGGLQPDSCLTVEIELIVDLGMPPNSKLVNWAEIAGAFNANGDELMDIDSDPDEVMGNDGGGVPEGATDNYIDGDGSGAPGIDGEPFGPADVPAGDEDDQDPAVVTIDPFDLALTKQVASGEPTLVAPGDTVTFNITIYNQGLVSADSVNVVDSISAGLAFFPQGGWMPIGGNMQLVDTTLVLDPALASGDSTSVSIDLIVTGEMASGGDALVNRAEIGFSFLGDVELEDIDSRPDSSFVNDPGGIPGGSSDDVTQGNGMGAVGSDDAAGDEDDNDAAQLILGEFDLALTKVVSDVSSGAFDPLDPVVLPGDTITYDIEITNQGQLATDSLVVVDSIPAGLIFYSDLNPTWNGIDASDNQVVDTTLSIPGGLQPNESLIVQLQLVLDGMSSGGSTFVNRAEIGAAYDGLGNEFEDIDSEADTTFTNDGGGLAGGNSDDVTGGDGSGSFGDNNPDTDEDDHDPAQVRTADFDLALTKMVTSPMEMGKVATVGVGDTVIYTITVYNQGDVPADSIAVADSIGFGLEFDPTIMGNAGWTPIGGMVLDTVLAPAGGLQPNASTTVDIALVVTGDALSAGTRLINWAEIEYALNMNGDTLQDIDSRPDTNFGNDGGGVPTGDTDNEIDGVAYDEDGNLIGVPGDDLESTDEDDHDPAVVQLAAFDLALDKKPSAVNGVAVADPDDNSGLRVSPGDTVTFTIKVYNQGAIAADTIEVADSFSMGLTPVVEGGWALMGSVLDTTLSSATGGLPLGGLQPDSCATVDIRMVVGMGSSGAQIINRAEIAHAQLEGDTLVDIDSEADRDFGNDNGGVAGTETDNSINGNGTLSDDGTAVSDEDDSDPALLVIDTFDLALRKIVFDPADQLIGVGDTVCYAIVVYNQGNITADTIQVFDTIPGGLAYVDIAENGGWSGMDGDSEVKIDTAWAPAGGLASGQNDTLFLKLRVLQDATNETLINRSELGYALNEAGDTLSDIDSEGDGIFGNDPGGIAEGESDDEILGDGSGGVGDDTELGDEDDEDPAAVFLDAFDLALTKTLTNDTTVFRRGDIVEFKITVINQGSVDADTIRVTDSIPAGLLFDPVLNPGWVSSMGSSLIDTTVAIDGGLQPGDSVCVFVNLMIDEGLTLMNPSNDLLELTNYAEISLALNEVGDTLQDIDSEADRNLGNDGGGVPGGTTDDITSGNGDGAPGQDDAALDEDDHDPESVFVEIPELGVSKYVSKIVNNGDGTYNVTYAIAVENLGNVALDSLQVVDSLDVFLNNKSMVDTFYVVRIEGGNLTPNLGFTGEDPNYELLTGVDVLAVDEMATIELEIVLEPGLALMDTFMNVAYGEALSPLGDTLVDHSTDGTDPDPNSDLNPEEMDTTMFTLDFDIALGVAKRVVFADIFQDPDPDDPGSKFRAQFEINVENYGSVGIDSIQVFDNLATTFMPCTVDSVSLTSDDFKINENYDGVTDTALLVGNDFLPFDDKGSILVTVILNSECDSVGPFFNTALAAGEVGGIEVLDTSFEGSDPDGLDNNGNPDEEEPTEVRFDLEPNIGVAKNVSEGPENNGDGTYDLTFEIRVENRGNVDIDSLNLIDELDDTFMSECDTVQVLGVESEEFQVNWIGSDPSGYDGLGDSSLLLPGQTLKAWDEGAVYLRLRVGPCDTLDGFFNSAVVMGMAGTGGVELLDSSQNGTDPDTDDDGITNEPGDNDPTPITFPEEPSMGLAKRLVSVQQEDGGYLMVFEFNIQNYGDIDIDSIQVTDSLAVTFPAPCEFEKVDLTSDAFTVNDNFDGVTDVNMLVGTDVLSTNPDETGAILLTIKVDSCDSAGPFENIAFLEGVSPSGEEVRDTSQDGSNPDPNDDGNPDEEEPTIITFPGVSLVKMVSTTAPPELLINGNYKVSFDFLIVNNGQDTLTNFQLYDDFQNQFGCVYQDNIMDLLVTDSSVVDSGGVVPGPAPVFSGSIPAENLLDGTGLVPPGAAFKVMVAVELDPDCSGAPDTLLNQATVEAEDMDGNPVIDESDDDMLIGDDPTGVVIPAIGVSKGIVDVQPVDTTDGNFIITYLLKVQNTGNVTLDSIQLEDELDSQLAPAIVPGSGMVVPGSLVGQVNMLGGINPTFNGSGAASPGMITMVDILDGTAVLDPGQVLEVQITIEVDASMIPAEGDENSAIAEGDGPNGENPMDSSEVGFNPDGSDDNGDSSVNTPTPLPPLPSIGIAKAQVAYYDAGEENDGNVLVAFDYAIKNNGNVALENIDLIDHFEAQTNLGPAYIGVLLDSTMVEYVQSSDSVGMAPELNGNFTGRGDDRNVFDGESGLLYPCDTLRVRMVVEVDPNAAGAPDPLLNTAIATGEYEDVVVEDESFDGLDPEGGDVPTPVLAPAIGLLKQVTDSQPAASGEVGNFDVFFKFTIVNVGNDTLTMIELVDNIEAQYNPMMNAESPFVGVVMAPSITNSTAQMDPMVNGGYAGDATDSLLLVGMDGEMAPGDSICVEFAVEINPNALDPPDQPLLNNGIARGKDRNGDVVEDVSDAEDAEGGDDPTGVGLGDINLAKDICSIVPAASGAPGNVDINFQLVIKNKGNTPLSNIQVHDDVANLFGPAYVGVSKEPEITYISESATRPEFGGFPAIVFNDGGSLESSDSIIVNYTVEVDPDAVGTPNPLPNVASARGEDPLGGYTTDDSDAGTDPESTNPGHPDDMGTEDDTLYVYAPAMGIAKKLLRVQTPQIAGYGALVKPGHFDAIYQITVQNLGNTNLDSICLDEDLVEHFGDAFVQTSIPELTIVDQDATEPFVANGSYTGVQPNIKLLSLDQGLLEPGQFVTLELLIEVNSNVATGPLENQIEGTARATRPLDAPTSPGAEIVDKDGNPIPAVDLSDCGLDPASTNPDDPFDMGTADDPTVLPDCWTEACEPTCNTSINVPLGPDCEIEITLDKILIGADPLCIELGFYTLKLSDAVGSPLPSTTITQQLAQRNPFFTATAGSIICPDDECWTEITIKENKKPIISDGFDTTVYCNDPFLELSGDDADYPKPWVDPACGTNFANGPLFVADWTDASFDCSSPFAKVIYREWEALGPGGERATAFDVIRVLKLPEITADNLICAIRDTIYCGDERVCTGPRLLVPRLDNPMLFDTVCLEESVEGVKCGVTVHVDVTDFAGDECEEQSKITVEIKQECYAPTGQTGTAAGNLEISGGNGEPVYVKCEMWLIELDTTPPELDKDLSKAELVVGDTIYVPTSGDECVAHTYLPPVAVTDCSEITTVKARVPDIGTLIFDYNEETNQYESHETLKIPHGQSVLLIYEAFDDCHNLGTDTCYIKVKDLTAPVAQCVKGTTVSISDKKIWVNAIDFDEGSKDNCGVNLIMARRSDWADFCVDLCNEVDTCAIGDHDTIWCPILEVDKEIDEVEAHYAQVLQWLNSDGTLCADLLYEAWKYDMCKYATLECYGHYYDDEDFARLYREKFPELYEEYGDQLSQLGGGWSDQVPFACEDACQNVTVELLVVDYWCNWSTCWTSVWVEDKTPISIGEQLTEEIEITCKSYKDKRHLLAGELHPLSVAEIVDRAGDGDEVALAKLDEIFGGYMKAWKDQYGNLVDASGDAIDTELEYIDSLCVCDEFVQEVWTYDEHLGYIKESKAYDSCWYVSDTIPLQKGLVEVNCAENTHCDQDIWAEFNHCGEGYIFREFKIWRECENPENASGHVPDTVTRKQRIWVGNECEINAGMFDIPADVKVDACGLEYDDLGNASGAVHPSLIGEAKYVFDDDCRLTGVGYSDKVFKVVGGDNACYKIIRTWHLMDWCELKPNDDELWWLDPQYESRVIDVDQKIIVQDTVAPLCEIQEIGEGGVLEIGGCDIDLPVQVRIEDLCGVNSYSWELKDNKTGDIVKRGDGVAEGAMVGTIDFTIEDLGQGDYKLKLIVTDECENEGGCEYDFEIVVAKKPQAICITSLTAKLNPMDLDEDGAIDTAMVVIWAEEFNQSSQASCGSLDPLEFKIELLDGVDDETFVEDESYLNLSCTHLGVRMIRLWVIDPNGAFDYCDVLLEVQDGDELCEQFGGATVSLDGTVTTQTGTGVDGAEVSILVSNGAQLDQLSDDQGMFSARVSSGERVTITPSKDGGDRMGISTADLIILQKHILGKKRLDNKYLRAAADVNEDGKISPLDMLTIRRIILGNLESYPDSDAWRFYNMVDDQPSLTLEQLTADAQVEFMGVKVGDVNLDFDPSRSAARSAEVLSLRTADRQMSAGMSYHIPVRATDLRGIAGYQFTLELANQLIAIEEVQTGELVGMSGDNFGVDRLDEGLLTTSWHRDGSEVEDVFDLAEEDPILFTVVVTALDNVHLSDVLSVSGKVTADEAYDDQDQILGIALEFAQDGQDVNFALYQNRPNPFTGETAIGFSLPEAMSAQITIYDVSGRVIKVFQGDYAKGFNQINVRGEELGTKGLLYYQLDTEQFTATRRMIRIE